MRGQGFEPEISAETPIPNKKGEAPTSPHCEYAIPIMDLISDSKTWVKSFQFFVEAWDITNIQKYRHRVVSPLFSILIRYLEKWMKKRYYPLNENIFRLTSIST